MQFDMSNRASSATLNRVQDTACVSFDYKIRGVFDLK